MTTKSVLFVCTGNVFRSVSAEYALRQLVASENGPLLTFSSAGTEAIERPVHEFVIKALQRHGISVANHRPRRLSTDIISSAQLTVAMGLNHQRHIYDTFGKEVPLFREVCFDEKLGVLDVDGAIPDYETRPDLADKHVQETVDFIVHGAPKFLKRISVWIR